MTRNTWIIFTVIVLALFGGLVYLSSGDKVDVAEIDQTKVQPATEASGNIAEHTFGNADSKVILTEYADYQCPGCKSAAQPIQLITEKYKDQLGFVFRAFPLTSIHPNAIAAAATAEVAGFEGKYWEMHDLLYENQESWSSASATERTDLFASYAKQLGIDEADFKSTLEERKEDINKKIDFDQALGRKSGVDGTPTFFLNGEKVDQMVKDGKIVPAGTEGATNVWAVPESFDKLILQPAFKEAGIDISTVE
jgi:protein-disulfide isomerase